MQDAERKKKLKARAKEQSRKRGEGRGERAEKLRATGSLLTWQRCCQPEQEGRKKAEIKCLWR